MELVVALDVGGTTMKSALVTPAGDLVTERRFETLRDEGPDRVVGRILDAIAAMMAAADAPVRGIGVVVPGVVNEDAGVAVRSANLGWRDVPLARHVVDRTDLPFRLGHDVRAGAIAEGRVGAARACGNYLFVPIGTGIGGAFILDGWALRGTHDAAVELGHVPVAGHTRRCGCGRRGCLETVSAASAIAREYRARSGQATASAADVASRAASGEPIAVEVWDTAIDALADGLATAVTLFDPEAIVIGGGLSRAGATLFSPLERRLLDQLTFEQAPQLRCAELQDRSGCVGAALLAWDLVRSGGA